MAISFEAALGVHDKALTLRSQRAEVLANNIANADTPGYQSRDMDFGDLLAQAKGQQAVVIKRTNARHISAAGEMGLGSDLKYRTPMQPSIDGNTVDLQIEQAEYADNAIAFQSSFTFLNGRFRGLMSAIRGE
jgi:flagellar basal-body rod protein FlgB